MAFRLIILIVLIILLESCGQEAATPTDPSTPASQDDGSLNLPETPPRALANCEPTQKEWERITQLYEDIQRSIHRIRECGEAQVELTENALPILLVSDEKLVDDDEFRTLSDYAWLLSIDLVSPFKARGEGLWSKGQGCAVRFFEPESLEPIRANPFALDSYFVDLRVDAVYTIQAMIDDIELRNHFLFSYAEAGPLAGLLHHGSPVDNPFVVIASIADIIGDRRGFSPPEGAYFGPLATLFDLEMAATFTFEVPRDGSHYEQRAEGQRATLGDIGEARRMLFDMEPIRANRAGIRLKGSSGQLGYYDQGRLEGRFQYEVDTNDVALTIFTEFHRSRDRPVTWFACADST